LFSDLVILGYMCLLILATSGYILSEIWPHSFLKSGKMQPIKCCNQRRRYCLL